jgi:hypothetical protein
MRDRNLSLEVHGVELRTLTDVIERFGLYLECRRCGRLSQVDGRILLAGRTGDLTLYELRRRARCSRCTSRDVEILLRRAAMRGDLAWLPRPPAHRGRD